APEHSHIHRLLTSGTKDMSFLPTANPNTGPDDKVRAVALEPGGKILLGGTFFYINGLIRENLGRLKIDGSEDGYNPSPNGQIWTIAAESSGKALVSGGFTTIGGANRKNLARLQSGGMNDLTFDPGTGINNTAYSMIPLANGKWLIGGSFTTYNGIPRTRIARINADGTLDATFDAGTVLNGTVTSMAVQPDGKIIVVGAFTHNRI